MSFNKFLKSIMESVDLYDDTEWKEGADTSDLEVDGTVTIDIDGIVDTFFSGGEEHPEDGDNIKNLVKKFLIKQIDDHFYIEQNVPSSGKNIITYKATFKWDDAKEIENSKEALPESNLRELVDALNDYDWDSKAIRAKIKNTSPAWLAHHNINARGDVAILNMQVRKLIEELTSEWWVVDYISCEWDRDLDDIAYDSY